MYFEVEIPENGTKNMFRDKETTKKVPLMFLDVKLVTESEQLRFWALSTNKQGTLYLFSFSKSQNKQWKR